MLTSAIDFDKEYKCNELDFLIQTLPKHQWFFAKVSKYYELENNIAVF